MKLTFVMTASYHARFIAPLVTLAKERGFAVEVITDTPGALQEAGTFAGVECHALPKKHGVLHQSLARHLRQVNNYLHWHSVPQYSRAVLRDLYRRLPLVYRVAASLLAGLTRLNFLSEAKRKQIFMMLEYLVPPERSVLRQLSASAATCVIILSKVRGTTTETEYQKAAQHLRIPCLIFVASWDNLTSKGTFQLPPEAVLIWNAHQAEELKHYHEIRPENCIIVGAPVFDILYQPNKWLVTRESFCESCHIPPDYKYFLYLVSSERVWGDERPLIRAVASALESLLEPKVLLVVKHHPKNNLPPPLPLSRRTTFLPRTGYAYTNRETAYFYNLIAHSEGVIGLSTTAFLEACALNKPCLGLTPVNGCVLGIQPPPLSYKDFVHTGYLYEHGFVHPIGEVTKLAACMTLALDNERWDERPSLAIKNFLGRQDGIDCAGRFLDEIERFLSSATGGAKAFSRCNG